MLVLRTLQDQPMRFGELRRHLEGVTQKMLTQTLRSMERNGIATRTVYATMPPSVEYALSPLGQSVAQIAGQMCAWAQENMKEVLIARQAYDRAAMGQPGVVKVLAGKRSGWATTAT